MSDTSQGRDQLVKEARVALPILGLLLLVFVGAAYRRFSGWADAPPASIRNSSIDSADENERDRNRGDQDAENGRSSTQMLAPADASTSGQAVNPATINREGIGNGSQSPYRTRENIPTLESGTSPIRDPLPAVDPGADESSGTYRPSQVPNLIPPPTSIHSSGTNGSGLQNPTVNVRQSPDGTNTIVGGPRPGADDSSGSYPQEQAPDQRQANAGENRVTEYRVRLLADETHWSLADRCYGSGQYFRALHAYLSRDGLEMKLDEGRVVLVPDLELLKQTYPELCAEAERILEYGASSGSTGRDTGANNQSVRIYQTRGGETLFEVSASFLGQASRFDELIELNRESLPVGIGPSDRLARGISLAVPAR